MNNRNQALACYTQLNRWAPRVGDFIIWSGYFSTWVGVLSEVNRNQDGTTLVVVFGGLPILLFTQTNEERQKNTKILDLNQIVGASAGTYSVIQHDPKQAIVWYV